MNKLRRVIASFSMVAILSMLVVSTTASAGQYFDDVPDNAWYATFVNDLAEMGIVDTAKDAYRPGDNLNRAEAVKLLVVAFDLQGATTIDFTDVSSGDWYYNNVKTAVANGLVVGYDDGSFRGGNYINRAEFAKVAVIAADLPTCDTENPFPDVAASAWYEPYATTAYCWSVIDGYPNGTFGGANNINRAEAAKMISNAMDPMPRSDEETPVTPTPSGDLDVSLNANSPTPGTLPDGATAVTVGMFDVTAGSGGAVLQSLKIHTYGVTSLPTDHALYLYDETGRLTSGKSVNSTSNEAVFNNLNLSIGAGVTKTLSLKLDTGSVSVATEAAFEIESAAAVTAGESTVGGSFPVRTGIWGLSLTDAGTITIEKNGTIANPKVGEDDVTIAKFKMNAATEAAELEQLALYVTGTIAADAVENFELYVSGEDSPIATVAGVNSKDLAAFVMDTPYEIAKGETKSFTVKADLNTGRTSDTLKMYVDESTDIVAIGGTYGYGMKVTKTLYDGNSDACASSASNDCTYSALEGGDITVSSSGPSAGNISIAGDDVTLLNFSIVSLTDVTFKSFPISLLGSESSDTTEGLLAAASTANFTDIKISNADTGETLMGPIDVTSFKDTDGFTGDVIDESDDAAIAYYRFTDEFNMSAGEELNLTMTTDVKNASTMDGMTLVAYLDLDGTYPEMRDVNNKTLTNSTSLVPASAITGKTMTVSAPSLVLSLAAVPASQTYVKGEKNIKFTGISAKCGSASNCKVTDVLLQGYLDDSGTADDWTTDGIGDDHASYLNAYVGSVWLEDSVGGIIAPAASVESDGDVVFDNMSWSISGGDTELFYIVGSISSDAYKNSDGEDIAFGIETAGDVDYTDDDGNSQDSTGTPNNEGTATTDPSTFVTVSDGGSLTISVDAGTKNEDIVVAGTADQEISKFKFTTTAEAFTVRKLSINARQSGVTTATLGDYDDNVQLIKVSYTNSDGNTETKTGTLTNGTANFGGMDFYIPKDDDAVLTVYATMNTVTAGADVGTYVDLNLAFNDFDALAESSGETYFASKIDNDYAAASDLDFGTITWVAGNYDINTAVGTLAALNASQTLVVNDSHTGDTNPGNLPVGTLLCVSADATCTASAESIMVVTSWTEGTAWTDLGDTGDSVVTKVLNNADTAFADADNIIYALPGSGYLTNAKQMHVYKTKPTLALSSGSPSGSRTQSPTDTIFEFTVTPNANEDVIIRQALAEDDENIPTGMDAGGTDDFTITTTSGEFVDGAGGVLWTTTADSITDNDCFVFTETLAAGLGSNKYLSFWIKSDQADTPYNDLAVIVDATTIANGSCTPAVAGDELRLTTTNSVWVNGVAMSSDTAVIGGGTANTWDLVTVDISGTTNYATAIAVGLMVDATGGLTVANGDLLYIDGVTLHNEMLTVDMSSNGRMDTTPTSIVDCTLKRGTTTVASNAAAVRSANAAAILIVPEDNISGTDYNSIEISKGTPTTFTLICDTQDMITGSVNDDLLTPSIGYGSSSDGTVTRGNFWWSADETTNTLVYWLGDVGTKLSGYTLKY
ncbi:MAG: S-layer homology domain-containing protein [Candidatus Peregrinibacteria bacterium]